MLYLRQEGADSLILYALAEPVFVRRQRNGMIVCCDPGKKAQGIVSPDGSRIWQLADRESLGEGYPVVQEITMAEYDEWYALQNQPEAPDPEDTDPVIPEDVEPDTVLTRAELTEKVRQLEQELEAAKALLGMGGSSE